MLDSAAEVLANIHAYGSVYIQRGNRILSVSPAPPALLTRFARLSPKIYGSEGQATGLEKRRRHPLMLFRSLVPADRTQTTCVTVVNNTGKPEPDIAYHEQKLMDADLAWQPEASHTPLRYAVLMARVRHVLEEIHREETALGKPETIVHGNYGCENLVYDRSRIVRVIGWQGLRLGSPLADLGQAFVMLMTDWSKPSRPHDCNTMADFNKAEAQRFYEHYATVMTRLCGGVMMPLNFPQVLQSGSLIKNYMRLACYRILVEQLESQGMSDYHLNIRCRVITQVLHVERLLWL